MESIILKSIDWCFSDEIMKAIASEILMKNAKSNGKVNSLQAQALKSIMQKEMETDVLQEVFFKLIFKKPIKFQEFMDQYPRIYPRGDTIIENQSPINRELKSDPELFLLILEQNLCNISHKIDIVIRRDELEIELLSEHVIRIPHRNDKEYDFDWADKFAKMAFSNRISWISLQIDGEGTLEREDMLNRLNDMIRRLDPKKPPEGWKEAIRNGTRTVWIRFLDSVAGYTTYVVQFVAKKTYHQLHDERDLVCFE